MKKPDKIPATFLAVLLTFLCLLSACKKEVETPNNPTAPVPQTLTFDKASVTPGDVVVVTTAADLDANTRSWEIGVNGRRLQLAKTDARRAVFVVPMVAAGPLTLDLSALGAQTVPVLTMAPYALIPNPDQVIAEFGTRLTAALTHVNEMTRDSLSPASAQDAGLLGTLRQQLAAAQAGLTPAQKLEAAYALQKMSFDKYDFATLPPRRTTGDPADDLILLGQQLAAKMVFVALATDVFMVMVVAPDPLTKFVAIAATVTAVYQMVQVYSLLGRISDRFDMIDDISVLFSPSAPTIQILTNNPTNLNIRTTARNLTSSDASAPGLRIIFAAENALRYMRGNFDYKYNILRGWFGSATTALTPYVNPIRQTALRRPKVLGAVLLRVRNVSNPNISIAATAFNSTLTVTATGTTAAPTTPFTFDLVYENAALGLTTTKRVNATYTSEQTVTDVDGNVYEVVQIGAQRWMKQNLKTTRYRDGSALVNGVGMANGPWNSLRTGAHTAYDDNTANVAIYGRLYNSHAVRNSRGICPTGWRVPTRTDWTALANALGGAAGAGGKMKNPLFWNSPNVGATNSSGFSAVGTGFRDIFPAGANPFYYKGLSTTFWSSTVESDGREYSVTISYDQPTLYTSVPDSTDPFTGESTAEACRCIKD